MKKLIIFTAGIFCTLSVFAQLTKPKPNNTLPSPKLRVYKPADLQITGIRLASINKDASRDIYLINVSLTIKNAGEMASQAGKLKGFNTVGFRGYKAPNHPPMKNINEWNSNASAAVPSPWTVCYNDAAFPAIAGGNSISQDFQFEMRIGDASASKEKFYFLVLADLYNSTKESNEDNNYSIAIFITPPVR